MKGVPRIRSVSPLDNLRILVTFDNSISKVYDVAPLLKKFASFHSLETPGVFNLVRVDCGGFGIVWTEDIDLSEYEIWNNGIEVDK